MRGDTDGKRYRRRRGGDGRQELKRRPFQGTVLVVQLAQFFPLLCSPLYRFLFILRYYNSWGFLITLEKNCATT
jgi:hypothetical protein